MSDQNRNKPGDPDSGWRPPAVPAEDTEAQGMKWSNRDLKKDVKPVAGKSADDTEGQSISRTSFASESAIRRDGAVDEDTEGKGMKWSNRDLKKDVKPVERKPADDTEGQSMSRTSFASEGVIRRDGAIDDDTKGHTVGRGH